MSDNSTSVPGNDTTTLRPYDPAIDGDGRDGLDRALDGLNHWTVTWLPLGLFFLVFGCLACACFSWCGRLGYFGGDRCCAGSVFGHGDGLTAWGRLTGKKRSGEGEPPYAAALAANDAAEEAEATA